MEPAVIEKSQADALTTIGHVPVAVHAELGRRKMTFGELINLREGDVVDLPTVAGENIKVYVGGALIGSGEVLMSDGALAIRIADLRDPSSESDRRKL